MRITKSPKIYVSDHGLVNAFAGILSFNQLSGHILLGSVWESLVLQNLKAFTRIADIQCAIIPRGSKYCDFREKQWWKHRESAKDVAGEYVKMVFSR